LVDVIERQWEAHESLTDEGLICPWVFNRRGRQIKGFVKAWKSACTTAGCPGKLPHDFRRTAIRNLVRSGVPEKTAMAITGHKIFRVGR
jgi:integrase